MLLITAITCTGYAQYTDTVYRYYDYEWNEVDSSQHFDYIRTAKKTAEGKWHVRDYYRDTKSLQMEGMYLDDSLTIQDGKTYYYHANGTLKRECTYNKNKPVGLYREYAYNGTLIDSSRFRHTGMPFHRSFRWDNDGHILAYAEYDMQGNGTGYQTGYYTDSTISFFGKYTTGRIQDSVWNYYRTDGTLAYTETLNSGKVISWQCFDEHEQPQTDCDTASRKPSPPYNAKAYLAKNMRMPAESKVNGFAGLYRVVLTLHIDAEGKVTDVYPSLGSYSFFNDEAVRVAKTLPKMTPAWYKNRPVQSIYYIPVSFRLE